MKIHVVREQIFVPFKLELKIENIEELKYLKGLFNLNVNKVKELNWNNGSGMGNASINPQDKTKIWETLSNQLRVFEYEEQ